MKWKVFCCLMLISLVFFGCGKEEISNEKVVGWGANNFGETDIPADLKDVDKVVAGTNYSLALIKDGSVVAWGKNDKGQTDVPLNLVEVVNIASGGDFSLALKKDGTVVAWGNNDKGQTDVPSNLNDIVKIVPGYDYSIVIKIDGSLVGWGANEYEQLDFPSDLSSVVQIIPLRTWVIALKSDGRIVSWGSGIPKRVAVESFVDIKEIVVSDTFNNIIGLKNDGTIVEESMSFPDIKILPGNLNFVEHISGDLGNIAILQSNGLLTIGLSPNIFENINNVKTVTCGINTVVILKTDETLELRGDNFSNLDIPQGLIDVASVSVGPSHILAIGKIKK